MEELKAKALTLGEEYNKLCNRIASLQNMLGQYAYDMEQKEQQTMQDVLFDVDSSGKPLYTNDTSRKAEHKLRLHKDPDYQSLRAQYEHTKDEEKQVLWTLNGLKVQIKTLDIATR